MSEKQRILVTGGTGYIGSHTVAELLVKDYDVFIIDNLYNSKPSVIERLERIGDRRPKFLQLDIRNRPALRDLFAEHHFDAVIHFAGLKAVGESVLNPLSYYDNNVFGSICLFDCMQEAGVKTIVFSSSCTVYGQPPSVPVRECFSRSPMSPYGRTKLMIENILEDVWSSDPSWRIALLRYFNPVGAHPSGTMGEDPNGIPNNLMPYIARVAAGTLKELLIFGDDYPTPDGTGIRDYIHVVDLARGHLAALNVLKNTPGVMAINLGTGRGYSVLEMVRAFEAATGQSVPYRVAARRPGDVAEVYADPTLAIQKLRWQAELGIESMCGDMWRWQCWSAKNLKT